MSRDDDIVAALRKLMAGRDSLQPKGLIERISNASGISQIDVKVVLARLTRQGAVQGISHQGDAIGRVMLTLAAPAPSLPDSHGRWSHALRNSGISDAEISALLPCHERLSDFPDDDLGLLIRGLLLLREHQTVERDVPAFIRSARYLLGSSKLLGNLPAAALRAFGIEIDTFPNAPAYLVVAGPESPEAVLLIENPHSFEEALAAGCADRIALVATYGYGLSRSGEAYGNALVESVGAGTSLIPLVRRGNPPIPGVLFRHPRIFFWGDLDREGLRIYSALRTRIPAVRLSAIYGPLCEFVRQRQGHPYTKATAKNTQRDAGDVPDDAIALVTLCESRAVDQEIVPREEIARLCASAFEDINETV
jgi:hypothetical protein